MAPPKQRSRMTLAEQIADLEDPAPRDFDPEDQDLGGPGSDSDDARSAVDENAGREHYEVVGKGKLRKPETIRLGKEYAGSKVSREALEAESDDDPFRARSSDEEGSEDEDEDEDEEGESGEDDEDEEDVDGLEDEDEDDDEDDEESDASDAFRKSAKAKANGVKSRAGKKARFADEDESVDGMDTDESDSDEGGEDGSEGSEGFDDEDEDDDESDLSDEDKDEALDLPKSKESSEREELRRLMATDQKTIAATISQAAKADAAKGMAVKQQRSTFDALLNTRIKLQKGLTAINELPAAAKEADSIDEEAIRSAESAALALWSTLEELRHTLADAQAKDPSKKRKRPAPVSPTASSASLWKRMTELESESLAHRRAILDKWSLKVRGSSATLPNARGKLLGTSTGSAQQTITAVLDAHVASEISGERAAKRSRRENLSNGTTNGTSENEPTEPIYDDTLFYQSLLRDLVEQRMSSSDAITNGVDALHIQLPTSTASASGRTGSTIHPVTGMRKDKVKRAVDTKASKGRKMRYNVHEKLQNFMAPEDRGTWTSRAREEFFASLLGKTASGMLGEDSEEENGVKGNAGDDSDEDAEEGGLRLFRSQ
ncbi:hypothetical protein VTN00DRAFT_5153 [Thermoascus crustaceus]|uniref:uncharacterized protein n=1 Tax=Thermoascus crustaceus TaxID=5088 RepID=UPI0037427839